MTYCVGNFPCSWAVQDGSDVQLLCEDSDSDVMSNISVIGEYHHLVIDDINERYTKEGLATPMCKREIEIVKV